MAGNLLPLCSLIDVLLTSPHLVLLLRFHFGQFCSQLAFQNPSFDDVRPVEVKTRGLDFISEENNVDLIERPLSTPIDETKRWNFGIFGEQTRVLPCHYPHPCRDCVGVTTSNWRYPF
jgi:hypothetical protein